MVFALDFRRQAVHLLPQQEFRLDQTRLNQSIAWFLNDATLEEMIREQVVDSVRVFGTQTYGLSQRKDVEPIEARIEQLEGRVRIRPIVGGVPGPVEFRAPALQGAPQLCDDLEDLLRVALETRPEERYLAWGIAACSSQPLAAGKNLCTQRR